MTGSDVPFLSLENPLPTHQPQTMGMLKLTTITYQAYLFKLKELFLPLKQNDTLFQPAKKVSPNNPRNRGTKKATTLPKFFFPLSKLQASFPFSFSTSNSSLSKTQENNPMFMETPNQYNFALFSSIIVASAVVSFALCVAAEFKKSKKNDLRLDGKLCYLPGSAAFELGIAALICLSITQVIGSLFICRNFSSREEGKVRKPTVSCSLLLFSWISFGIAVIIISAATSMSRSQAFGEGWLDGECYLVKDGVYVGSAILALLALGSSLGSGVAAIRRKKAEESRRVHAKVDI